MERRKAGTKKSPDGLTIARVYVPRGRYASKQWMNYLTNLHLYIIHPPYPLRSSIIINAEMQKAGTYISKQDEIWLRCF